MQLKNVFYLAILTTVVVATWIASTLYYSITNPTVTEDISAHTTPISPSFDTEIMDQVGNRIQVQVDLSDTAEYIIPPEDEISESTSSADIEAAPSPTPSPIPIDAT